VWKLLWGILLKISLHRQASRTVELRLDFSKPLPIRMVGRCFNARILRK